MSTLKPLTSDLTETLEWLEEETEVYNAMGDDEGLKRTRQHEVQLRKLAREAGYNVQLSNPEE